MLMEDDVLKRCKNKDTTVQRPSQCHKWNSGNYVQVKSMIKYLWKIRFYISHYKWLQGLGFLLLYSILSLSFWFFYMVSQYTQGAVKGVKNVAFPTLPPCFSLVKEKGNSETGACRTEEDNLFICVNQDKPFSASWQVQLKNPQVR